MLKCEKGMGKKRMKKYVGIICAAVGAAVAAIGAVVWIKGRVSAIIGGADGPTAIFLAGKIGNGSVPAGIIAGIVLLTVGIIVIMKKK